MFHLTSVVSKILIASALLSIVSLHNVLAASDNEPNSSEFKALVDEAAETLTKGCHFSFKIFLRGRDHNAFFYAMDTTGNSSCGWTEGAKDRQAALDKALGKCEASRAEKVVATQCILFAEDNRIVGSTKDFPLAKGEAGMVHAIERGLVQQIVDYVKAGIDVNTRTPDGDTALMAVAAQGNYDVYMDLLASGADHQLKLDNGSNLLMAAMVGGDMQIIRHALQHKISPNEQGVEGNTAMHVALARRDLYKLHVLMSAGGDPTIENDNGQSVISALAGFDSDLGKVEKEYTFWNAHKNSDLIAMQELLSGLSEEEKIRLVNQKVHAAHNVKAEVFAFLLDQGANPNHRDRYDSTPLIEAVTWNAPHIVRLLLAAGADKSLMNDVGKTAMDYAKDDEMRNLLR